MKDVLNIFGCATDNAFTFEAPIGASPLPTIGIGNKQQPSADLEYGQPSMDA